MIPHCPLLQAGGGWNRYEQIKKLICSAVTLVNTTSEQIEQIEQIK
jgi:hypothetical protein